MDLKYKYVLIFLMKIYIKRKYNIYNITLYLKRIKNYIKDKNK